jgi:glycosyltransferase involved in cell wall biosynthesis
MKVILLSYEDAGGGAGRAAFKLHRALRENGVVSLLQVRSKRTDSPTVMITKPLVRKAIGKLSAPVVERLMRLQRSSNPGLHSPAWFSSGIVDELNQSDADVLQLNFICGLLSIEEIGKLEKPLVWRLSDMWPFSGTEHYGDDGPNARWRTGYTPANRPGSDSGPDIDRWAWRRKRRAWKRPIHIVAPSRWLADCVRQSSLMRDWPVTIIPTALDVRQFQPWPKELARGVLGLPQGVPLILFGALSGGTDPRKGRKFLEEALSKLASRIPDVAGVIFGQSEPANPPRLGLPLHWMGHLNDDATLSLLYSAADVMVIPSRQDNLPQTGVESQSCGCPVVTFNVSGLPDLVEDRGTGYLARAFEIDDLANGIEWVLKDPEQRQALSRAARERALRTWAPAVVIPQYLRVYETAIAEHQAGRR